MHALPKLLLAPICYVVVSTRYIVSNTVYIRHILMLKVIKMGMCYQGIEPLCGFFLNIRNTIIYKDNIYFYWRLIYSVLLLMYILGCLRSVLKYILLFLFLLHYVLTQNAGFVGNNICLLLNSPRKFQEESKTHRFHEDEF